MKQELTRKLASLVALVTSAFLCLATSAPPGPPPIPPVECVVEVPFDSGVTTRRVRVLMTGHDLGLYTTPAGATTAVIESANVPLLPLECSAGPKGAAFLCVSADPPGFVDAILRLDLRTPSATPVTVSVTAQVWAVGAKAPSTFKSLSAYAVDLELLP